MMKKSRFRNRIMLKETTFGFQQRFKNVRIEKEFLLTVMQLKDHDNSTWNVYLSVHVHAHCKLL